jgi:myo-inositol 2-dehydrogenase / D-chiro-inositol 1-dehydrogenase
MCATALPARCHLRSSIHDFKLENNMEECTRRSFLKVPAAAAAAVGAPALLMAQAPSDTLRVAFVGTGNRGSYLLKNMVKVPGVKVVAVCDIRPERVENAAKIVAESGGAAQTYADFRKMLDERKDVDAVVLATPDWTHKDFDLAILEVGKHLYSEKPMALTPADCKAVAAEVKRSGKTVQFGLQLRHDPATNAAEQFIHNGGIGRVLMCHGIRHSGEGLPRDTPWYHDRTKSGDMIVDQGIHILDLFRWAIGGHPIRAYGTGGTNLFKNEPPGRTCMDGYSVIYEYANGVYINFSHQYYDPPAFTGTAEKVFGTEGSVDLVKGFWQRREKREQIKLDVPNSGMDSTYMALASFVDSVKTGKQPINCAESAMDSTLQALMGTKAIYEQRVVTWDEMVG